MDFVLAAILLAADPGTPVGPGEFQAAAAACRALCVRWEYLGSESAWYFAHESEFQSDLDAMRRRRAEMAGLPRVGESNRLPNLDFLRAGLRLNRAYRSHLDQRAEWELDRAELIGDARAEALHLYRVWDAAADARDGGLCVAHRRRALGVVREALGADGWDRMEFPPAVPVWRFSEQR